MKIHRVVYGKLWVKDTDKKDPGVKYGYKMYKGNSVGIVSMFYNVE